jgi:hypothetical protein
MRQIELEASIGQSQDRLTTQEVAALKFRLGLLDGRTHSLKETGVKYGMTVAEVKRGEGKVLGMSIRRLSGQELRAILSHVLDDPQLVQKVLAECYEEQL